MKEIFVIKVNSDGFLTKEMKRTLNTTTYTDYTTTSNLKRAFHFNCYDAALDVIESGKLDKFSFFSIEKYFTSIEIDCFNCLGEKVYWVEGILEDCEKDGCIIADTSFVGFQEVGDSTLVQCPYCSQRSSDEEPDRHKAQNLNFRRIYGGRDEN